MTTVNRLKVNLNKAMKYMIIILQFICRNFSNKRKMILSRIKKKVIKHMNIWLMKSIAGQGQRESKVKGNLIKLLSWKMIFIKSFMKISCVNRKKGLFYIEHNLKYQDKKR